MANIIELLKAIDTKEGRKYWLAVLVKRQEVSQAEAGKVCALMGL